MEHAYNLSYSEGQDRKIMISMLSWERYGNPTSETKYRNQSSLGYMAQEIE
jgi:hypothetical protein